ncbi:type IV secretion protein Rhs [Microbispora sp. RL4-1S]|uniref:Type IV secretion protein Rhs n=1 Tax=Microbispora oryzae TaxID=2806554 RepID=A0A940WN58_9ACTN|nr:RHS repeat-associated core domain-containing protein [Microbispora oryzae]MBP2706098.1 type IV secretion protein Rhs [Microbispora oryzae]
MLRRTTPIAAIMSAVLAAGMLTPARAAQAPFEFKIRPVQKESSVPGTKVTRDGESPLADSERRPWKAPAKAVWPAAGTAEVDLSTAQADRAARAVPRVQAGKLPVRVGPGADGGTDRSLAAVPSRAEVDLADRSVAARAGVDGLLVTLRPDRPGPLSVQVDYSAIKNAYGADWASRLTLVRLPECALSTPDRPECREQTPLAAHNDTAETTVTVDVDAAVTATVLAATAAPAGASGSFKATSLAPSGEWAAGGNSGGFGYKYGIDVPSVPGELEPTVSLDYSSSNVDGRVASTNNQPSWVGEGWDYDPGYIERSYMGCNDDKGTGANNTAKTADLCWKSDNATLSLDGSVTALVRDDDSGVWRLADDDGSRVEHLNGTATDTANGDNDNEYWRITKTDGTQYWFGKNRLPGWASGKPETGSTYTVPVFGNHAGEPCHATAYADSSCTQGWRWRLDYVVDAQGNAMAYYYAKETNSYAKNLAKTATASYVRGGYLSRIEYGLRAGQAYAAQAPAKVVFGVSERCLSDCGTFDAAHAANWPDAPFDQNCASGATCTNIGPSFWTRKRLTSITTQVLSGTAYKDIDSWALTQQFPGTGDNTSPGLWLAKIARTGKAVGTAITLPAVTFYGTLMDNRVDADEGRPPLHKYRITRISSESGADTLVTYSGPDCTYSALPDQATNTKRCYPSFWTPDGYADPVKDWFHKYLVTQVAEDDTVAGSGSETKITSYEYLGGAAWKKDDSEFTLDKQRTYNQFRGYATVRTKVGASARTQSDTLYFRGLGGPLADSEGNTVEDDDTLAGLARETITYTGEGGSVGSATVTDPWVSAVTASRARPGLSALTAKMTQKGVQRGRTLVTTATGTAWRRTRADYSYNQDGLVVSVSDQGDVAMSGDEECKTTTYTTRDAANWLLAFPATVKTTAGTCTSPGAVTGEVRNYYDDQALNASPKPGQADITKIETLDHFNGTTPVYAATGTSHDIYGRVLSETDELGHITKTVYTPATGIATGMTVTDPKGFATTSTLDPGRGLTLTKTDANGRTTYTDYDALGRLTAVWLPGRAKTAAANTTFTYAISATVPTAITQKDLLEDGSYRTSITLYDGLLRERQTQEDAHNGGRLVEDTFYDSHGRDWKVNDTYWNSSAPSTSLLGVADNLVPSQTVTEYDGQDRETASIAKSLNVEKWRTTTVYGGNYTAVVPPGGGTASLEVTDASGRTTELRQYKDRNPVFGAAASQYNATKYGYDKAGNLISVVDPAGNTWTYGFDLRGNRVMADDPDAGVTRSTYDLAGQLLTSTDSRGVTLTYQYDELGRKKTLTQGTTKLAQWDYDALAGGKGMAASSTRYDNGNAYVTAVKGYDSAGRSTGSTVTIPAAEGALAGTYTFGTTYRPVTGAPATTSFPAAGGLAAETVSYGYTKLGQLSSLSGSALYVSGVQYSPYSDVLQTVLGDVGARVVHTLVYEDSTRRLAQVVDDREKAGPQTMDNIVYTYNPIGDITRVHDDRDDKSAVDTQCYTYDYNRRLTEGWTATNECAAAPTTATVGGPAPYWQTFTYDAVGNRTSEVQHAGTGDVRRTYTYPGPGQPQPHTLAKVDTTGPGARTDSFEYDAAGNTTRRVTTLGDQKLVWNAEGDLAASTIGGKTSTFVYDAEGTRLLRREPGKTTLYLGGEELALTTGTGKVSGTRYYEGPKATVVRTSDGQVDYLIGDRHDTDELSVNATTLAYSRRSTTPYGGERGTAPASWPGEKGFVGGTIDESTGLTHIGAREYDVAIGRFVSVDPVMDLTDPQQINGYAYSNDNPVGFSDPSGTRLLCGVYGEPACPHTGTSSSGDSKPKKKKKKDNGGTASSGSGSYQMNPSACATYECYRELTDKQYAAETKKRLDEINRLEAQLAEERAKAVRAEIELAKQREKAKKKKRHWWDNKIVRGIAAGAVVVAGIAGATACGISIVCGVAVGAAAAAARYTIWNAGTGNWNWTRFGIDTTLGALGGGVGRAAAGGKDAFKYSLQRPWMWKGESAPAHTAFNESKYAIKFMSRYQLQWRVKPTLFNGPSMMKYPN